MKRLTTYKLFENPNTIIKDVDGVLIDMVWSRDSSICFSYYHGKFYTGKETHIDLANVYIRDDKSEKTNQYYNHYGRGELAGRLFLDEKIITFWFFPKDKTELKKVADDIKKSTGIGIWNDEWRIEITSLEMGKHGWGDWTPTKKWDKIQYIPIKDYEGSEERSEEEIKTPHFMGGDEMKKAGMKPKKPRGKVPAEYKSKSTKFKYTESFKLFENPDTPPEYDFTLSSGKYLINRELDVASTMSYRSKDSITFGYTDVQKGIDTFKNLIKGYKDAAKHARKDKKLMDDGGTYPDGTVINVTSLERTIDLNKKWINIAKKQMQDFIDRYNLKDFENNLPKLTTDSKYYMMTSEKGKDIVHYDFKNDRDQQKLNGRIWYERKMISFWKYPTNYNELIKVIKDIEKSYKYTYGIDLDIYKNRKHWLIDIGKKATKLIDFKEGEEWSEEELKAPHFMGGDEMKAAGMKPKKPRGKIPVEYKNKTTRFMYTESFKSFGNNI